MFVEHICIRFGTLLKDLQQIFFSFFFIFLLKTIIRAFNFNISIELQVDSEEERLPDEKYVEELAKKLPQGTDKTPEVLEEALKGLPDKYVFSNYSFRPPNAQ